MSLSSSPPLPDIIGTCVYVCVFRVCVCVHVNICVFLCVCVSSFACV